MHSHGVQWFCNIQHFFRECEFGILMIGNTRWSVSSPRHRIFMALIISRCYLHALPIRFVLYDQFQRLMAVRNKLPTCCWPVLCITAAKQYKQRLSFALTLCSDWFFTHIRYEGEPISCNETVNRCYSVASQSRLQFCKKYFGWMG